MKTVRIIDAKTARRGASEALASYLRLQLGHEIDVAVVDAAAAGLPEAVVQQLRENPQPAMVVDGTIVALGDFPTWGEAIDLVEGGEPMAPAMSRTGCCSDPNCRG
jgi:hypothetical protein